MSETDKKIELTSAQKQIFTAIDSNDVALLKTALTECPNVNFVDETSMTPVQHAAYKGNAEMVQMLLDQGADSNLCKHENNYTALHFAALSGNVDVCLALLMAGADSNVKNSVNRSAAQMAAFVGNHSCVSIINNYVPRSEVDYYTVPRGTSTDPDLPLFVGESFHKLILHNNIHPVKIALNAQNFVGLSEHLPEVKKTLEMMSQKEMKKGSENNEVLAFKYHHLSYIIGELIKIKKRQASSGEDKSLDVTELFTRKILKPNKNGSLEFLNIILKEDIREFPHIECTLFRQMVKTLTSDDPPTALSVITSAINGQRGFIDNIPVCQTCNEEKPAKKCAKCKSVMYCDRNCQRLHWHWHKKDCGKIVQKPQEIVETKMAPDTAEITNEIKNLLVQN